MTTFWTALRKAEFKTDILSSAINMFVCGLFVYSFIYLLLFLDPCEDF